MRRLLLLLLFFASTAQALPFLHGAVAYQAATPTFSPVAGTYTSTQSITISDTTPSSTITYCVSATTCTPSITYTVPVSVSSTSTVFAWATASGYTQSATGSAAYTINTSAPFPRIGVQSLDGSLTSAGGQCFPAGAAGVNDDLMARFGWILLGGNADNWASICTARSRQAVVTALHGFTHTGVHAVTPLVYQYEDFNEGCDTSRACTSESPWWTSWIPTQVNTNNWWTYVSGSSGTVGVSSFDTQQNIMNMGHVVGTDPGTGLWPYQLVADLLYQRYILGTAGNVSAATNLDGLYSDNMAIKALAHANYDWLRIGSQQNTTGLSVNANDIAAVNATLVGKKDFMSRWASDAPSYPMSINTEAASDAVPIANGGDGMTNAAGYSDLSGLSAYPMEQYMWGSFNSPNSLCSTFSTFSFLSFANSVVWYQYMSAYSTTGTPLLTGCVNATPTGSGYTTSDADLVRYALAFTTVIGNGYAFFGTCGDDMVSYGVSCTIPQFDEFWGGNRNLGGWLGAPLGTSQGNVQTAATQNGIWRRDFANGIVLINGTATGINGSGPIGGSSGTISLGGTYFKLNGVASVNSGGAGVTSVTLAPGQALFLTNTGPNYRPAIRLDVPGRLGKHATRAANDDYFVQMLKEAI